MDFLTIFLAALVGIGLLVAVVAVTSGGKLDLKGRLADFDEDRNQILTVRETELRQSVNQRIIVPTVNRIGATLTARFGSTDVSVIERQLVMAGFGRTLTASGFLALRFALGIGGLAIGALLVVLESMDMPLTVIIPGLLGMVGFILPKSRVDSAVRKRKKEILRAMPAALDLLTICVQGGLSFDSAMQEVASKYHNALTAEMNTMLNEIRLGRARRDAMKSFGERIDIIEVTGFVDAILQSEQLGSPLADALTVQSEEIRRRRRQRAEELGQKAPIKMLLPLVGCVFPTIFVILLGPAALTIIRQVMGVPQ